MPESDRSVLVFIEREGRPGGGKGLLINSNSTYTVRCTGVPMICYAWTYRGRENGCNVEMQKELAYCLREPGGGGSASMICYAAHERKGEP